MTGTLALESPSGYREGGRGACLTKEPHAGGEPPSTTKQEFALDNVLDDQTGPDDWDELDDLSDLDAINLTIVAGGRRAFYRGIKGLWSVIWDLRMGLYREDLPDPDRALDWVSDSSWCGFVEPVPKPLSRTIYGSTTIDFDRKLIVDDNGYSRANAGGGLGS